MAGLTLLTAGDRSRLGEESRDDGLDDNEWGDIGLANGEAPWWSKEGQKTHNLVLLNMYELLSCYESYLNIKDVKYA